MNKRLIMASVLLLLSVFTLAGCKKTVTEEIAEQGMENALGAFGDVDVDGNEVTIETDNGTMTTGDDLKLPSDWPEDVHVAEGKIGSVSNMNGSYSITIFSDKSVEDLKKEYDEKLENDDWKETMSLAMDGSAIVGADKDDRSLSLSISIEDGETTVVLVVNSFK